MSDSLSPAVLQDAIAEMTQFSETVLDLTATGGLSVDTFTQAAAALDFLNKKQEQQWKLNDQLQKQADKDLKDKAKQQQQLKQLASSTTLFFAATSAGVMTMVRAASPTLFSSFTGSLELLAGTVGQSLIPAFMEANDFVLDLVDGWNDLSDSTKELVSESALAVAGTVAVAVTLGHAASAVTTLGSAVKSLAVAAYNHPITAMVGALTAAAAAMGVFTSAAEALQDAISRAEKNITSLDNALDKLDRGENLSEKDLSALTDAERKRVMEAKTAGEQVKVWKEILEAAKQQKGSGPSAEEARKRMAAIERGLIEQGGEGGLLQSGRAKREVLIRKYLQEDAGMTQKEAEQLAIKVAGFTPWQGMDLKDRQKALDQARGLFNVPRQEGEAKEKLAEEIIKRGGANVLSKEQERALKKSQRHVDHMRTMIGHNKEMAPSFTAIDQARKNFQLAAFKDPIEQKKLQMQRDSYQIARRQLQKAEEQLELLKKKLGIKNNPLIER